MSLFFKTIAVSESGHDVFTVWSYFFAKSGNVYINRTIEYNYFVTPDSIQHFIP